MSWKARLWDRTVMLFCVCVAMVWGTYLMLKQKWDNRGNV